MAVLEPPQLPQGYTLRRATVRDLRAVQRLEKVIFPRDVYPYLDLLILFLWPGIVNLKITAPDGALAGFVSGIRALRPEHAWIITIGTARAHQRRGLGTFMLHLIEQRMARPAMRLTVRESNHHAIRLYHHTGYTTVERKKGYYRDGEAGLILEKRVKQE
ncbi:MAG: GNAT family N-acetyltransferase [Anaerolineae bacterium]|nr:GNAT family N-acetyltransferase [Anaerolineae bacterium]